jgi:ribosome biogenesis GTPase
MTLADLGFDDWFRAKRDEARRPDCDVARVSRVDRDRYLVRNAAGELQAEPAGRLLYATESAQDLPAVGDWALVQYFNEGTLAIVHDLLPRRTVLRRKAAGARVDYQVIAANIDTAFIVQACGADFNLRRMERYLVMARDGRIEPVILLSKADLAGAGELDAMRDAIREARIDAEVIAFSNRGAEDMDTVRRRLEKGRTYCLLGSSGVGKTTLLNNLLGREAFATAAVREKDERGRHTTTQRQMTVLDAGALIVDTPGLRELGMLDTGAAIDESFADIAALAAACRFADCTHTTEEGCGLLEAVARGELDEERYRSYMKLVKESDFHALSYAERRRKDRDFGRFLKTAKEQLKLRKGNDS